MAQRLQLFVEFVDQGNAVGDVQADDLAVGDAVEVLDQGADRIAVRRDHQAAAAADGRRHRLVPERQHARDGVLEAFRQRDLFLVQLGVADVAALAARIARLERRRRGVVAAPPDQHLLVAVLLGGLALVEALQPAIVALVEAPGVHHRQPGAVELVERVPERAGGALEDAGVGDVEVVTLRLQQPARLLGLLDAGGRQIDIGPAGETVLEIPGRFAVADQYQFVHGRGL